MIREWEEKRTTVLERHWAWAHSVFLHENKSQIVFRSYDRTMQILEMSDGEWEIAAWESSIKAVLNLTMSEDGSQIISNSAAERIV